jgi:xanthine dehydrogenase accessory factor
MSELLQVAEALTRAASASQVSTLATVVRTEGSTYRRIGARMVVLGDGSHVGAVSAGCLEADVVLRSAAVRASGRPEVVTYDTRSADDLIWGFGLGCGGLMELLLEPLDPEHAMAKAEGFRRIAESRHRTVLVTVIRTVGDAIKPGDQARLDEKGILRGFDGLDSVSHAIVHRAAHQASESGSSEVLQHTMNGHEVDLVYEVRSPTMRLCVCGAGPDAVPLVAAAKRLAWNVTVIDHRSLDAISEAIAGTDCDAAIVMNHHYERDLEYLAAWIRTDIPYIGMLGPRDRTERMLATLESRGTALGEATRQRIRAPVGLDIGAETPEEIALAIVGEVQALHVGRGGGFLSSHAGPIHGPAQQPSLELPRWVSSR